MNENTPDAFKSYARRCGLVFLAVVCGTLVMVGASFAPIPNHHLVIALVIACACANASIVASYLMHLVSEQKTIYAVLAFTVFFFAGLMALSLWAHHDLPALRP